MGQGKENAKEFLIENSDVAREIEERLRTSLQISSPGSDEVELDEDSNGE
jgi:recombination protein RecA